MCIWSSEHCSGLNVSFIGLLTFALFMSARMGIYQEVIYGKYGKHPKEALFYTHALPLPGSGAFFSFPPPPPDMGLIYSLTQFGVLYAV